MKTIMPPSIKDGELIAKCSPRGWGNVVWTSYFARHNPPVPNAKPKPDSIKHPAMVYVMEHWTSTKRSYRAIEGICITNLYCGVGKGWDIVVHETIIHHEGYKTSAQREAEKLLDGQC